MRGPGPRRGGRNLRDCGTAETGTAGWRAGVPASRLLWGARWGAPRGALLLSASSNFIRNYRSTQCPCAPAVKLPSRGWGGDPRPGTVDRTAAVILVCAKDRPTPSPSACSPPQYQFSRQPGLHLPPRSFLQAGAGVLSLSDAWGGAVCWTVGRLTFTTEGTCLMTVTRHRFANSLARLDANPPHGGSFRTRGPPGEGHRAGC